MTVRTAILTVLLLPVLGIAGCGSCQPGEKPEARKAEEKPPAAAPEDAESDCFVIVDAEPDFGAPPLTVNFIVEIDCTAEPVTYSWDFGDGTTGGNDPNPSHVYEQAGDFIAVVTARSADGGVGDDEIDITVDEFLDEE